MQPMTMQFDISRLHVIDGCTMKSIQPNSKGIYENYPICVIKKASQNNVYYLPESIVSSMTNPNSAFYKKLLKSGVEGEWGHPYIRPIQEDLHRVVWIDRLRVSHVILAVRTKETSDGKYIIVYGDIKPTGKCGHLLITDMEDPDINVAFSLRALSSKLKVENGITFKKILHMEAFDAISAPGYNETSKRFYQSAIESMNVNITPTDGQATITDFINNTELQEAVGFESLSNDELFDVFNTDKIVLEHKTIGVYDNIKQNIVTTNAKRKSVFHTLYNKG